MYLGHNQPTSPRQFDKLKSKDQSLSLFAFRFCLYRFQMLGVDSSIHPNAIHPVTVIVIVCISMFTQPARAGWCLPQSRFKLAGSETAQTKTSMQINQRSLVLNKLRSFLVTSWPTYSLQQLDPNRLQYNNTYSLRREENFREDLASSQTCNTNPIYDYLF